jgi:hypothetical protein
LEHWVAKAFAIAAFGIRWERFGGRWLKSGAPEF